LVFLPKRPLAGDILPAKPGFSQAHNLCIFLYTKSIGPSTKSAQRVVMTAQAGETDLSE
jgi:hypothetical protein